MFHEGVNTDKVWPPPDALECVVLACLGVQAIRALGRQGLSVRHGGSSSTVLLAGDNPV